MATKTNKYILSIFADSSLQAKFVITYRNSWFHKVDRKSGRLPDDRWPRLMLLIPQNEEGIEWVNQKNKGVASLEPAVQEGTKSIYSQFTSEYFSFYEAKTGITPIFRAVEGKALKSIINHLQKITADDAETLATWQALLTNWNLLDSFYEKQIDLRQINSNINHLLNQIKNGKSTDKARKSAEAHGDDLRKSL